MYGTGNYKEKQIKERTKMGRDIKEEIWFD